MHKTAWRVTATTLRRIREFQEAIETEAQFHLDLPEGVVQEGRYQSDHPSYPVRWIVREALQDEMRRTLYGSTDPEGTQVTRQQGMEYVYRAFMHREHSEVEHSPHNTMLSDTMTPRIDMVFGALFESDLYSDHVLTDPLLQYRNHEHHLFLLNQPMHHTVEIVLFWLGEHGALLRMLETLTTTFHQTTRTEKMTLHAVQQVFQYILLQHLITALYDTDVQPGTPWSWRAPVHIATLIERVGDFDTMQYAVNIVATAS